MVVGFVSGRLGLDQTYFEVFRGPLDLTSFAVRLLEVLPGGCCLPSFGNFSLDSVKFTLARPLDLASFAARLRRLPCWLSFTRFWELKLDRVLDFFLATTG